MPRAAARLALMYQCRVRRRPIEAVAAEYASFRGKVIIFWDDNLACDREYAKTLFRAIAPHRKWWSSQASIQAGEDEEFLELAAKSGCKQLFIGLESISQASMNEVHKGFNRVEEYARVIERNHSYGIAVPAGIVFGFDHDTDSVFSETLDFFGKKLAYRMPRSTSCPPTPERSCTGGLKPKSAS